MTNSEETAPSEMSIRAKEPWLLDSREVSRLLGIGRTKVFQMMARTELPVVRVGRCVRVPREALCVWIDANTAHPTDGRWPFRGSGRRA